MKISNFDTTKKTLIIAEIGNNHEGSFALAEELVGKAAETGVAAVKFQTFKTEHYVNPSDVERFKRLKSFELKYSEFEKLSKQAKDLGLLFISTPFDLESATFLNSIVDAFKIASGDNTFYPLIEHVASFGKPTILSTGLADIELINKAKSLIQNTWKLKSLQQDLAILHCVSSYPVPPEEANLKAIAEMKEQLGICIGYSDHTLGIEAPLLSLALGAEIIEKHFTIDKNYSAFRDHQLSADPKDLKLLVDNVLNFQHSKEEIFKEIPNWSTYMGSGQKVPQPSESAGIISMRRSIIAKHAIPAGKVIEASDLTWVRPGTGLPPGQENKILGKKTLKNLKYGDLISPTELM